jgi:hypothetical protein
MVLTPRVRATSHPHSDAVEVAPREIDAREAAPAIAAVVCIVAAVALWHVVIATALGAVR